MDTNLIKITSDQTLTENDRQFLVNCSLMFVGEKAMGPVEPDSKLKFLGEQCCVIDWINEDTGEITSVDCNDFISSLC